MQYIVQVYCDKRQGGEQGDFLLPDPYTILAASQVRPQCSANPTHYDNLVPRVLSLPPSRKYPGFGWSRGTQNLGANKNVPQGRGSKV